MDKGRLKKIKEHYSDAIDIALSDGGTLPYYDIDVADMNWLIARAELAEKMERYLGLKEVEVDE
ncbi:hypothetical protein [Psychrobacillus sp.]|uniref:hypothetical protein n=1 Tax=Psychrobacillus sp. TaxID=1871623 RepID=UPI0028BF0028|nr:hypothetical protein [Psychrobacillus sp.]